MSAAPPIPRDAIEAAGVLRKAAELNRCDPLRRGSLLEFPAFGQLVMTGDMHGHRKNFEKLRKYAHLDRSPQRHVMLHELIHQDTTSGNADTSYELLLEAAAYKCEFPDQVHFLQSNHELAQLTGQRISKGGRDVLADFDNAVLRAYGQVGGADVLRGISEFIASLPLAARTPNRVWLSHSLPNDRDLRSFDPAVIERDDFDAPDRMDGGSVYMLVWGRYHSPKLLMDLGETWNVDTFIVGHQPQETGFDIVHNRMIVLASDHNHGTFLPFDLSKEQSLETLAANIRKFVEVG